MKCSRFITNYSDCLGHVRQMIGVKGRWLLGQILSSCIHSKHFPLQHSLCLTHSQILLLISAWSSMCAARFTAQGPNYIFQLCSRLPQSKIKPTNVHFLATTLGPLGSSPWLPGWQVVWRMPAPFPLPPGELFLFSSLLFSCIRPSLSTQVHLTAPQTANCPLESTTKTNPCSPAPYRLWQQLMFFSLPVARSLTNVFMLLPLHPVSHSFGSEWVCVKAPSPANVEMSPGTKGGNPARCSWSGNQTSCSEGGG